MAALVLLLVGGWIGFVLGYVVRGKAVHAIALSEEEAVRLLHRGYVRSVTDDEAVPGGGGGGDGAEDDGEPFPPFEDESGRAADNERT